MRSRFFSRSFLMASAPGSPVSAANPAKILSPLSAASVLSTSGFRTSARVPSIPPFLSFDAARRAGRQSATAAHITSASQSGSRLRTASSMSHAETTSTRSTPGGVGRLTGPATSTASCPARAAARATAKPILPVDGLERNRTGSANSRVGPAVTRNLISRNAQKRPRTAAASRSAGHGRKMEVRSGIEPLWEDLQSSA